MLPRPYYQRLGIAVLERTLVDAWSGNRRIRHDARAFISREDSLMRLWCQAAHVAPWQVRRRAKTPPEPWKPRPGNIMADVNEEDDL
jgi:hypothetical protein